MFYSAQTGGFYSRAIHGDNIPADAVEISSEIHAALINGQSQGQIIMADDQGHPVLSAPLAPTPEYLEAARKAEALQYLNSTDWYFARKAETGQDVPADVLQKREDARALMNEVA